MQQFLAEFGNAAFLLLQSNPYLVAGLRGDDVVEPVLLWHLLRRSKDLDRVAALQLIVYLLILTVDASAGTLTTDIGVDAERKIKQGRTKRQPVEIAFGRKRKDFLVVDIHAHVLHQLHRSGLGRFENIAHIVHPCVEVPLALDAFVLPMGRKTLFGDRIHPLAAYLHLDPFIFRTVNRYMQ